MEPPDIEPFGQLLTIVQTFNDQAFVGFAAAVILLLCSALLSASEIAFFTLNAGERHKLSNDPSKKARRIRKLLTSPGQLMNTLLIANVFSHIGVVVATAYALSSNTGTEWRSENWVLPVQIVIVAFLILVFGEVLPRMYAAARPESIRNFLHLPLRDWSHCFPR